MNIDTILREMTLEEKAALCSGEDFWHTKAVERLDIPSVMVSDGPHGLRKMADGADNPNCSIEAVCFPSACAAACSFDRELLTEMGKALGEECQAENVSTLLGPGCNIKRSPLCGRNFEYFSEDPYLASQLAAAHIRGVQSKGVGTSLKHFAANNQENRRMSVSAEIDERTLHEIYLAAFETAVKESEPWTVMCSYNKINGEYVSQNKYILTDVLRNKWGYKGLVMSDWGAVDSRPDGIRAGLDLEMPGSMGKNDKYIIKAVEDGELSEDDLDVCVRRILEFIRKSLDSKTDMVWDKERHHKLAEEISVRSAVLLKNENETLPLSVNEKIAFIGEFAEKPRYQGGGSSHIKSYKTVSALEAVKDVCDVVYAKGFSSSEDKTDEALIKEAVAAAQSADKTVVFAGLPEVFESEGYDRTHMRLPDSQLTLINELCKTTDNIIIVLHGGSPVELPFSENVKAILNMYLGGQAVGAAAIRLLFGKDSPCGKLAETFPVKLEDNPSYLNFPGEGDSVKYAEGIFVGYRYYEKKKMPVRYPFGHGLSYTEFEYSDITVSSYELDEIKNTELTVGVTVKNTGGYDAYETVQLYVAPVNPSVIRPVKELAGFEKVFLKAGESRRLIFRLNRRAFSYYSDKIHDFYAETGEYDILLGASSADIRLSAAVHFTALKPLPFRYTLDSPGGDLLADPAAKEAFIGLLTEVNIAMNGGAEELGGDNGMKMAMAMVNDLPLHKMVSFTLSPEITREKLMELLDRINGQPQEI